MQFVAFSGGGDSTCMAFEMRARGEDFALLHTPTGNELPEVAEHVRAVAERLGVELVLPPGPKLEQLMEEFNALPSNRMRWCTRMTKIKPCLDFLTRHPDAVLCVGLRADEPAREGIYSKSVITRFPLREWGFIKCGPCQGGKARADDADKTCVTCRLRELNVQVPARTDCAWCYDQRLVDWRNLLRRHPAVYAAGEAWEKRTGHTFRSPHRDTWPAGLAELKKEFESGRRIRGQADDEECNDNEACRVCRL